MRIQRGNRSPALIRCGIILAAGDGQRLRDFVGRLRGDTLPKQYVNFIGARSMLEHTYQRAEKLIPSERLFTVIARNHLRYPEAWRQVSARPKGTVVVQPANKETAPGLLLPLMYLYKRHPESTIAVFPSDHFIWEEDLFMHHVKLGFQTVEEDPSQIILLGLEPDEPDPEYGYIIPGAELKRFEACSVREVKSFVEKPEVRAAKKLIVLGGLWNTFVIIFRTSTLLQLVRNTAPRLYQFFQVILRAIGSPDEARVVEDVYRGLETVNFSKGILEAVPRNHHPRLSVLPVHGVVWSDWGSSARLLRTLCKAGRTVPFHGSLPKQGVEFLSRKSQS